MAQFTTVPFIAMVRVGLGVNVTTVAICNESRSMLDRLY